MATVIFGVRDNAGSIPAEVFMINRVSKSQRLGRLAGSKDLRRVLEASYLQAARSMCKGELDYTSARCRAETAMK